MELRVLQYFLAVAREQNISAAAHSLHLTQPTLSRQLRELEEELALTAPIGELQFLGLINDDDTEVGRVHLGLCFLLDTDGDVSVRETEKLEGLWLPLSQLASRAGEMETWSSLLLDTLTDKGE